MFSDGKLYSFMISSYQDAEMRAASQEQEQQSRFLAEALLCVCITLLANSLSLSLFLTACHVVIVIDIIISKWQARAQICALEAAREELALANSQLVTGIIQ